MAQQGCRTLSPPTPSEMSDLGLMGGMEQKYVEDVKQDEKHVPDLLESIMRPTCLVKEELRTNLCKSNGLQTRLNKKQQHIFHPSSQAPGPGPGPAAKKDGNYKRAAKKTQKNAGFSPPGPVL